MFNCIIEFWPCQTLEVEPDSEAAIVGRCDWSCNPSSRVKTTENGAVYPEVEICSILNPGLRSLAMQVDGMASWSENESPGSRLVPGFAPKAILPVPVLFR
jgi:hypothetical protein